MDTAEKALEFFQPKKKKKKKNPKNKKPTPPKKTPQNQKNPYKQSDNQNSFLIFP